MIPLTDKLTVETDYLPCIHFNGIILDNHCTLYDDLRRAMIVKSERRDIGFRTLTETEKITFILKYEERQCAKFIFSAMHRRKSVLYR